MNKTEHFQLNLWDSTDRIMMEDFNADNAKIDQLLVGKLGPIEQIREVALEAVATSLTMDISDMDWGRWNIVFIEFQPISSDSTAGVQFSLRVNGTPSGAGNYTTIEPRMILAFPLRNAERPARALYFPGGYFQLSTEPYSAVTSLVAYGNKANCLSAGSVIRMYGIR